MGNNHFSEYEIKLVVPIIDYFFAFSNEENAAPWFREQFGKNSAWSKSGECFVNFSLDKFALMIICQFVYDGIWTREHST